MWVISKLLSKVSKKTSLVVIHLFICSGTQKAQTEDLSEVVKCLSHVSTITWPHSSAALLSSVTGKGEVGQTDPFLLYGSCTISLANCLPLTKALIPNDHQYLFTLKKHYKTEIILSGKKHTILQMRF